MSNVRALSLLALIALTGADAHAGKRPNFDVSTLAPAPLTTAARPLAAAPVVVHATDPARGVPTLLWAADPGPAELALRSPVDAARAHLLAHRARWDVPREVIDAARPLFTHDTGRGGVIVGLRQRVGDIDVFHGDLKVLLGRDNRLLGVAGAPHPAAVAAAARPFGGTAPAAIAIALGDMHGGRFTAADFVTSARRGPRSGSHYYDLTPVSSPARGELAFREPARVKPVYFPRGDSLLPAYLVELQVHHTAKSPLSVHQYVVAADTGALLMRRDATASDAYTYMVWADEDGDHRPADGPLADFTPHPTGQPNVPGPEGVKPTLITVEGLNTNPDGAPDPWLPPGATETVGNNVDAYVDFKNPNGLHPEDGEFRAAVTSPGVFDLTYDISAEPMSSVQQSMAAVVTLFYVNNWLHDWWYDSGFDEAAGNAQADNLGRGGEGGDPIKAEGQDGALEGSLNNANMSTPLDGGSPVMQMYLWSPAHSTGALTVEPGAVEYTVSKATFGPQVFDLTAPLVMLEDGMGADPNDGCEPPVGDVAGKVVLIHRGNCTFETKVTGAQLAGAVGALIANHMPDGLPSLGNDNMLVDPTIPTLGLTLADGQALEASLDANSSAHLVGAADAMRDGTIDGMIIAHEFGHYLHHRLEDCGSAQCGAMSEGWGDFDSLLMMLRAGDPLDAVYAGDTYAGGDEHGYFGIRRVPYSTDRTKNALSFRHIADGEALPADHPISTNGIPNSEVHNAGEIWATMMWEAYIALHKAHQADMTFDEVHRLMADYVVAGMMMTPVEATFTEQRDAILLAAAATSKADFLTLAEAFASRGAGSCAIAPPVDSTDFVGVVEDFAVQANGTLTGASLDDSLASCDNDGIVDGGERGRLHVEIANGGVKDLPAGTVVKVAASSPSLVFPAGDSVTLESLAALEKTAVDIELGLVQGLAAAEQATVTVTLTTPEGCTSIKEIDLPTTFNGDILPKSTAVEEVETPDVVDVWSIAGQGAADVWSRKGVDGGHVWHGRDLGRVTDAALTTPPLQVSASDALIVRFDHAYQFEFSDSTYWDGGVIEVTSDGGKTWQDVAELVQIPYGGPIASDLNPINGKMAFVDKNPSYPMTDHLDLDFGTKLAGETIQLRFRIATDGAAGGPGWELDHIAFEGLTNTPFSAWAPDQAQCAGEETSGGATDTDTDAGTASDSASSGGGQLDDEGCGCRTDGSGAPLAPLGLALLALRRRRRRVV